MQRTRAFDVLMEMAKAMEINVNDHDTHARISKSKFY